VREILNDRSEGDSSGRPERNLLLRQCVARTFVAAIVYAAGLFNGWLGLTLLVLFGLIVLLSFLPTLITVTIEAFVGMMVYLRIRRGINLQSLKKLDGNAFETDLGQLAKMNVNLIGKEIYSIALVIILSVLLYQR